MYNWKDKHNVLVLSSVPELSCEFKATGKNTRNRGKKLKPQPVTDINASRKGVDMSVQLSS